MAELAACKPVPISLSSSTTPSSTSLVLLKDNRVMTNESSSLVQLVPTFSKVLRNGNISSTNTIYGSGLAIPQSSQSLHSMNSICPLIHTSADINTPSNASEGLPKYANLNSSSVTSTISSCTTVPVPYVFTNSNGVTSEHQNHAIQDIIAKGILHDTNVVPAPLLSRAMVKKASHSVPVVAASAQVIQDNL